MKNVFSKSREDLQKVYQLDLQHVMDELKVINSNVLYITYRIDKFNAKQQTLDANAYYSNQPDSEDNSDTPEGS